MTMFPGIMSALRGGGPQNITPQTGAERSPWAERSMQNWQGPLGQMLGKGVGSVMGYTPGQIEGFQGAGGMGGAMGQGGLIGFIQRALARRRQQQPPMQPGAAPAPPMAPPGPQGIMAPQTGTGPPGAPGAVY